MSADTERQRTAFEKWWAGSESSGDVKFDQQRAFVAGESHGYKAALQAACEAIENEKVDAEESDFAYNRAIDDCKACIRSLEDS